MVKRFVLPERQTDLVFEGHSTRTRRSALEAPHDPSQFHLGFQQQVNVIRHNHVGTHDTVVCLLNRENLTLDNCHDLVVPQPLGTKSRSIEIGVKMDEVIPVLSLLIFAQFC